MMNFEDAWHPLQQNCPSSAELGPESFQPRVMLGCVTTTPMLTCLPPVTEGRCRASGGLELRSESTDMGEPKPQGRGVWVEGCRADLASGSNKQARLPGSVCPQRSLQTGSQLRGKEMLQAIMFLNQATLITNYQNTNLQTALKQKVKYVCMLRYFSCI